MEIGVSHFGKHNSDMQPFVMFIYENTSTWAKSKCVRNIIAF